ncbi:MAG: hypothetical protein ABDI19_02890, partial [Armatimonadota bacterium]
MERAAASVRRLVAGLLILWLSVALAQSVEVQMPRVALQGVPFEVSASGLPPKAQFTLRVIHEGRPPLTWEQT